MSLKKISLEVCHHYFYFQYVLHILFCSQKKKKKIPVIRKKNKIDQHLQYMDLIRSNSIYQDCFVLVGINNSYSKYMLDI